MEKSVKSHKEVWDYWMKIQSDEVLQIKWFNKNNLPDNIHHNSKHAIIDYFALMDKMKSFWGNN